MIRDTARLNALLETVRRFVREIAIPNEARVAEDAVPEEIVAEMRRLGLFGWSIPEEYGGAGLTTEELALANIELSQCSVAFRARVGTNTGIGSEALVVDGTPEQKRVPAAARLGRADRLPRADRARGRLRRHQLTTTATPAGRPLRAQRHQALHHQRADRRPLHGDRAHRRREPQRAACRPSWSSAAPPGSRTRRSTRKMGQAGSPVSEVHFHDCRVPAALIGGAEGQGFRSLMKALNKQRINLAALCIGPAIRMLDEALRHATKRQQFGQPIGDFQLVQAMVADCKVEIDGRARADARDRTQARPRART